MKLCFVSVNGPREPYLLDEPRITITTTILDIIPRPVFYSEQFPKRRVSSKRQVDG
jgi:hypothetical protein